MLRLKGNSAISIGWLFHFQYKKEANVAKMLLILVKRSIFFYKFNVVYLCCYKYRKRTRKCDFHSWIHFIIRVLDRNSVSKLYKGYKIEVSIIRGGSTRIWKKSEAKRVTLHLKRTSRDDWKISTRAIQCQIFSHCGTFIGMHIGTGTCCKASCFS